MRKQKIQEEVVEEKKSPGKFQVFLFIFFIPILFVLLVGLVIASFYGVNVFEKAEEFGISVPFGSDSTNSDSAESSAQKVVTLQTQVADKDAEIAQLQAEIDRQVKANEDLVAEQDRLKEEMANLQTQQELEGKEMSEIVAVFKEMPSKSAAPVFLNMEDSEAVAIMSQLAPDLLADVLSKMPPADAARYTQLLSAEAAS